MARLTPGNRPVRLVLDQLEDRSTPATLTVTNTNDAGTGSLRAEIAQANADGTPDTIVFDASLAGQTINLTTIGDTTIGPSALFVTGSVTIQGAGQIITRGGGAPAMRLFAVGSTGSLTLENLTLTNGLAQGGDGRGLSGGAAGLGGAVYNEGTLQIFGATLTGNQAVGGAGGTSGIPGGGGGLGGPGNLDGTGGPPNGGAANGGAGGFGGGGGAGTPGTSTANGGTGGAGGYGGGGGQGGAAGAGTLAGAGGAGGFGGGGGGSPGSGTGTAGGFGGGTSSTTGGGGGAGMGGAVFTQGGTVVIANSTITANTVLGGASTGTGSTGGSAFGAGLFNLNGTVTLTNVTISGNTITAGTGATVGTAGGGALYDLSINVGGAASSQTAKVTVANSILANTSGGQSDVVNHQVNGTATIDATGPNLVTVAPVNTGGTLSGTTATVAAPLLGALANNGGLTQTLLPQTGSPALGTGTTAVLTAANFGGTIPNTDQRGSGFPRTTNGTVDIGAVQVQPTTPIPALSPKLVVSGLLNGQAEIFTANTTTGQYATTPSATVSGFPGFTGLVRSAMADVNGDGIPDTILVTGPGTPVKFAVISGADNTTVLVAPTSPFAGSEDFTGGGFVAGGNFEGTGRADIVVTPDQGGGPRVVIFALTTSGLTLRANFFGINDPNFRGGARPAVGDVNHDGTPDLAVAAGFLGGPRIALFNGTTVLSGNPTELVNDFFAFPGADAVTLRNGAYVSIGDVNGDGFADLIFGGGPGGAPRVFILSGQLVVSGNIQAAYDSPISNFFVNNNSTDRGGVRVAAVNPTGATKASVAVGSGQGNPAAVRVYLGQNITSTTEPSTFQDLSVFGGTTLTDGVYVG